MNQTQRDLTYRLDAVKSVCEQNGQESEICQKAIQTWELQHSTNIVSSQIILYTKWIGGVFAILILGLVLYSWFLKMKHKNSNK